MARGPSARGQVFAGRTQRTGLFCLIKTVDPLSSPSELRANHWGQHLGLGPEQESGDPIRWGTPGTRATVQRDPLLANLLYQPTGPRLLSLDVVAFEGRQWLHLSNALQTLPGGTAEFS